MSTDRPSSGPDRTGPLPPVGIRVVDAASLFTGPVIATMLGDHGADVIKVAHPTGDTLRKLGWEKDGVSQWRAVIGRNKRSVTLKLPINTVSVEPGPAQEPRQQPNGRPTP